MRKVSSRRTRKNRLIRLAVVLVASYFLVTLVQLQLDIYKQRRVLEQLNTQCLDQKSANDDVERYLSLHDDTELIEKIAREKLGFAYPDETVFFDASGS